MALAGARAGADAPPPRSWRVVRGHRPRSPRSSGGQPPRRPDSTESLPPRHCPIPVSWSVLSRVWIMAVNLDSAINISRVRVIHGVPAVSHSEAGGAVARCHTRHAVRVHESRAAPVGGGRRQFARAPVLS